MFTDESTRSLAPTSPLDSASQTPSASRTERRRAKARAEIVSAALGLFKEQGFDATSVAQITDRADYGVGTFYNHFAGKRELVRDVVADRLAAARGDLMAALNGADAPVDKIRAVVLAAGRVISDDRTLFALYFETHRTRQTGVIGAHAPEFEGMLEAIIEKGQVAGEIRDDVPPAVLAESLQAFLQSSTMSPLDMPLIDNLTLKVDLLLTGLRPAISGTA